MSTFNYAVKAAGHYIEQPAIIEKAAKWANTLALGSAAAIWASDVYGADAQDRPKTALKVGLVLGATLLGTLIVTRKVMMPWVKGADVAKARKELIAAVDHFGDKYPIGLKNLMLKETKRRPQDFVDIIEGMRTQLRKTTPNEKLVKAELHADLEKIMPVKLEDDIVESLKKMAKFFLVGGVSVLSGLAGGFAVNKITGEKGKTIDMIKEGVFQFIANIALCAVGGAAGIYAVNRNFVKDRLAALGMTGKFLRTGIIGIGLSLGIVGGGAIANYVGQRWVNPFFDKLEGKQPGADEKRKIEFWDAILHLDDLPTALALAGVKIMEPFIPLFFGFSGYRTGIGYRNGHSDVTVNPFFATPSRLMDNNRVFQGFYHQRRTAPAPQAALLR